MDKVLVGACSLMQSSDSKGSMNVAPCRVYVLCFTRHHDMACARVRSHDDIVRRLYTVPLLSVLNCFSCRASQVSLRCCVFQRWGAAACVPQYWNNTCSINVSRFSLFAKHLRLGCCAQASDTKADIKPATQARDDGKRRR